MPLQATSGAASYDAFGGGVPAVTNYIEDVFSTYLYTGNSSIQTITNGIDLSGKGGMIWFKDRTFTYNHQTYDTARGVNKSLVPNATSAQVTQTDGVTAFNNNGFTVSSLENVNDLNEKIASWTFRKQPKFFDVVTYTGNGVLGRQIPHNLGSVPGCIIVKRTNASASWYVYHRGVDVTSPQDYVLLLDQTLARINSSEPWNDTAPTATNFTVGDNSNYNGNGDTYVAYLFAHDAGGFGLTGTDNVISCGSFTTDGSGNATVSLGYEPQWLLTKGTSAGNDWFINDNMRGLSYSTFAFLNPNYSDAETVLSGDYLVPNATGFTAKGFSGSTTFIYIAIRRGPMKVPTSGTSVFSPNAVTMTASGFATITTNFPVDLSFNRRRSSADQYVMDRLRGGSQTFYNYLRTQTTGAETTGSSIGVGFDNNTALVDNNWQSGVSSNTIWWSFRRAPSFFDEVCYTGTGVARTVTHNLAAVPELMIVKRRSAASFNGWPVYVPTSTAPRTNVCLLNTTASAADSSYFNSTAPTSTVFSVDDHQDVNASGNTYVAYLFATCAGVSKVGRYTGTGTTLQIDCGFTGGARFVLIKKTSGTGDWYVWDSARGIVSGNDPYLLLNSTAAEVTGTDYIDTYSAGFEISSTAPSEINESGGTFIFFAVA
jgi:hypothetical protein